MFPFVEKADGLFFPKQIFLEFLFFPSKPSKRKPGCKNNLGCSPSFSFSEGVKAVQGDDMLCEKRFAPDTRYMVEFLLLEQKEQFGEKGEYHRYFLTKEAYQELINLQNQGVLRFQRQALVLEGTLHYLPAQAFFRDRE